MMRMRITGLLAAVAYSTLTTTVHGQVSLTSPTATYTQNFDTLSSTVGTGIAWSNNTTIPGWSLFAQPAPGTAITTYDASTGSATAGTFYSFGVAGTNAVTDRALGGLASGNAYFGSPPSGTVAGWMAVGLTNNTGVAITRPAVSFDGEQWRNNGNTTQQTMVMEYGKGATFAAVTTWTPAGSSFNFTSPIATATAAALDGNAAANRVAGLGGTLDLTSPSFTVGTGETIWIRWIENNDVGNDHALAIDNFSFTPVPEPTTTVGLGAAVLGAWTVVRRKRRKVDPAA